MFKMIVRLITCRSQQVINNMNCVYSIRICHCICN